MNILVMSDTHGFLPSDKDFFNLLDEVDRIAMLLITEMLIYSIFFKMSANT